MSKKSRKNLAKIAAGLLGAYALSKMGKGTMDGTEGDFPASAKPKRGSVEAFRQAESERQARIAAMRSGANMGTDRSAFNKKVKEINEARTGMKNPRYKKGGSVHVKTKIGYSKATKIY